jgi:four helix bundle protein
MKPINLEERLIQFSVDIILMCNKVEKSFASEHLAKQLIRSATSSALNYGEARSGESTNDFLHKMKICLKELRESYINLKIQKGAELIADVLDFKGNTVYNTDKPEGHPRKGFSCEKLRKTGWEASIFLREGIQLSYEWYKQNRNK